MESIDIAQKHSRDMDELEILEVRLPYLFVRYTKIIYLDGVDWLCLPRSRVMRSDHEVSKYVDSVIGGLGDANFVGHCVFKIRLTEEGAQLASDATELLRVINQSAQLYLMPASSAHYGESNTNFAADITADIRFFLSK
jgi:hypothetical protein